MLDPVTLEVIRNTLPAIANEMAADLQRTSYNMMIYEVCDFCTTLTDAGGRLISQNVGGVSHFVADLGVIIEDIVAREGPDGFASDDVFITNHQRVAGQHLNNVVVYMPFVFRGRLMGFAMTRAHWIDVGGMSTGLGATPAVSDPWFEGLQIDQMRIYEAGKLNKTLEKMIRDNIRYPESSIGDMRAQIAACRLAIRRLEELVERYSPEVVEASIGTIFRETETRCRNIVRTIPNGVYEAESFYDDDTVTTEPVRIHARVTVADGEMTIDLSGCSGQRVGGLNSRTLAGTRVAYKALTEPAAPVNEGSFAALRSVIPEGNIMMARYPAPMGGWSLIVPTVVDTIFKALAPAIPDRIPAAHHGLLGGSIVFLGRDPKSGANFVLQSLEGGGWGGRPNGDGMSGAVSVCQGNVKNSPIETMEIKTPVLVEERALRPDSGGPGRYRGGLGIDVRVRNLVEGKWNLARPRRRKCPPWGLDQGKAGGGADYLLQLPDQLEGAPIDQVMRTVPPRSVVTIRTGAGGGWGDPYEREAEAVLEDVREGLVSVERAKLDYGVVIEPQTLEIDAAKTRALRSRRAEAAE
ncbi:hydantoinase B/oxoprolinase family protein [Roseiarcaceae bacterium H3SJ34-1]|uniref:hydantoinase B/oxoprolinase family protein n=1 Tax=Terripilifer ovatus TaxID=3032367 RepID=UPI003AB96992|nr:hydantoinase B/oxoprolinase family protein [Roseiarcaceae bacterium H3SJ34-1]